MLEYSKMDNREQNDEWCDATETDSSNVAGPIICIFLIKKL